MTDLADVPALRPSQKKGSGGLRLMVNGQETNREVLTVTTLLETHPSALEQFRGPRGPKGETGAAGTPTDIPFPGYRNFPPSSLQALLERVITDSTLARQTFAPVAQHRIVKWTATTGFEYPSASVLSDRTKSVGITLNAGVSGDWIALKRSGLLEMPLESWIPDLPLFLGENGLLTQTVPSKPTSAYSMRVGSVLSPTLVVLDFSDPVGLA